MKFDQIRRVRKAAHVTQEELAKRIGVNRALISKYRAFCFAAAKNCFSSWCANDGTARLGGRGGTNQTG